MQIDKTDWERIKKEAEAQIKQASIMLVVNQRVLEQAEDEIKAFKKEVMQ